MNFWDNVTNSFMHIQAYSYKSDLGLYDAITDYMFSTSDTSTTSFLIPFTSLLILVYYILYYFNKILLDIIMALLTFYTNECFQRSCLPMHLHGLSARGRQKDLPVFFLSLY